MFNNITFTKRQKISVVVGKISSGDGYTSFGFYSVDKGGNATTDGGGTASGNLASSGVKKRYQTGKIDGGSGGSTIGDYGTGGGVSGGGKIIDPKDDIIILTYVGK